jgi:hypothetical protein
MNRSHFLDPRRDVGAREWPTFDAVALYGLPGDVVGVVEPHSEADPAALLLTFLTMFGSAVGGMAYAAVGGARHPARLFTVIVGDTAKSRKGVSFRDVRQVFDLADHMWTGGRIVGGLASGEGLIAHLQNQPGSALVLEEELSRVLTVASREGSTVSQIVRQAWDDTELRVMTKKPLTASGANVSIVAHITLDELHDRLADNEVLNGFANRFLFACARRSKRLPSGGNLDSETLGALAECVARALDAARAVGCMRRSAAAECRWEQIYDAMAEDDPGGMLGAATARAEAQVLRLSVAYALADGSSTIEVVHLDAAYALWHYCRASAAYIFGDASGNPLVERVVQIVHEGSTVTRGEEDHDRGIARSELHKRLGSHTRGSDLDRAIAVATRTGRIHERERRTAGRSARVLYPGPAAATEANETKEDADASHTSLRSQESQPQDEPRPEAASTEPRLEQPLSNLVAIMRAAHGGEAHRGQADSGTRGRPTSA